MDDELIAALVRRDDEVCRGDLDDRLDVEMRDAVHGRRRDCPAGSVAAADELDGLALAEREVGQITAPAIDFIELIRCIGKGHCRIALCVDCILRVIHMGGGCGMHQCPARRRRNSDAHALLLLLVAIQARIQAVDEIQNLGL